MPKHNTRVPSPHPTRKTAKESLVCVTDLVELIMEPLAAQIDRTRLEMHEEFKSIRVVLEKTTSGIFNKLQAVDDSVEILAAQKARDIKERHRDKRGE